MGEAISNRGLHYKNEMRWVFQLNTRGLLQSGFLDIKVSGMKECIKLHQGG